MRYSKRALLVFGAGLLLGLILVSANLDGAARIGTAAMAGSLLLLPVALVVDWWSYRPWRKPERKPRKRTARRPSKEPPRTSLTRKRPSKPKAPDRMR